MPGGVKTEVRAYQLYINGEWVSTAQTFDNRNPANIDEVVGQFVKGRPADVADAAQAAHRALPEWSNLPAPLSASDASSRPVD